MPNETLFAFDQIDYADQPIGLVVAHTYDQAVNAVTMVNVKYKELKNPILTIQDAIAANSFFPPPDDFKYGDAETAIKNAPRKISGNVSLGAQFHFHLENHVAISEPTEDGIEVNSSTQFIDLVQKIVAQVLNIKSSHFSHTKLTFKSQL